MKFFGGLSVEETATALNVSTQTVLRDWSLAKAWLRREMTDRSGEVDVVSETILASTFQQPKQRSPFGCSGSTADHNDDATMWLRHYEMRKSSLLQVNSRQPRSWANWRTASSEESPGRALRKSVTS
jgi:hypothetical protein